MLKSLQTDRHSDERRTTGDQKKINNQPPKKPFKKPHKTRKQNKIKEKRKIRIVSFDKNISRADIRHRQKYNLTTKYQHCISLTPEQTYFTRTQSELLSIDRIRSAIYISSVDYYCIDHTNNIDIFLDFRR